MQTGQYIFRYDPNNSDTLVMLRKMSKMSYIDPTSGENFPSYLFLTISEDANIKKYVLKAIKQGPVAREQLVKQFCNLAKMYYSNNISQIIAFQKKILGTISTSDQQILRQYTKESFFHKLLNNLLRSGRDCFQLYYGQYFIKIIHTAIQNGYRKNKKLKNFTCYRGACLRKEEINQFKNCVGKHIETLGFMSTSLSKQTAKFFSDNAFFQIEVIDQQRDPQIDYGYIMPKSQYFSQMQVLFNALNSFKIINVQTRDKKTYIKMRYGSTANLLAKFSRLKNNLLQLSKEDQMVVTMIKIQKNKILSYQGQVCQNSLQFNIQTNMYYEVYLGIIYNSQRFKIFKMSAAFLKIYKALTYSVNLTKNQKQFMDYYQQQIFQYQQEQLNEQILQCQLTVINFLIRRKEKFQKVNNFFYLHKKNLQIVTKKLQKIQQQSLIQFDLKIYLLKIKLTQIQLTINYKEFNQQQVQNRVKALKQQLKQKMGIYSPLYIYIRGLELKLFLKKQNLSQQQIQSAYILNDQIRKISPEWFNIIRPKVEKLRKSYNQYLKNNQYYKAIQIVLENMRNVIRMKNKDILQRFWKQLITPAMNYHGSRSQFVQIQKILQLLKLNKYSNCNIKKIQQNIEQQKTKFVLKALIVIQNIPLRLKQQVITPPQQIQYLEKVKEYQYLSEKVLGKYSYIYISFVCLRMSCLRSLGRYQQANQLLNNTKQNIKSSSKYEQYFELLTIQQQQQ